MEEVRIVVMANQKMTIQRKITKMMLVKKKKKRMT